MHRKPIFDFVRGLLGRGFRQAEVDALDRALDQFSAPEADFTSLDSVTPGPCPGFGPRMVAPEGVALIKRFEGCARLRSDGLVEAYPDPGTGGAPWTIGWGATGSDIGPGTVWTQAQCDARLTRDIARHAAEVSDAIGDAPTSQAQFDALVSFHYNTGAIARATLTRRHVSGDVEAAAREFARWKFAGGRAMNGLIRRRKAEAFHYRGSGTGRSPRRCTV